MLKGTFSSEASSSWLCRIVKYDGLQTMKNTYLDNRFYLWNVVKNIGLMGPKDLCLAKFGENARVVGGVGGGQREGLDDLDSLF